MESLRTDRDRTIIDAVAAGLVEVGKDDDVARLRTLIEGGESYSLRNCDCMD